MNFFPFQQKEQLLDSLKKKGRYRLLGPLGKGRHADIFRCFDTNLNRIVALKQFRRECLGDEIKIQGFFNETKLISYLDHPGVVSLYDIFVNEDGLPCYTMKLISGNNFRFDISKRSRSQLIAVFTKLCETLAYVHDRGVVHLDLNPDNILIGQYGEVMITDWGSACLYDPKPYMDYLALVRDAPPPPTDDLVKAQFRLTPYMAPEQVGDSVEPHSPLVDIFSMGTILYEMMTGVLPFSGTDEKTLTEQILNTVPVPMHKRCRDIPVMLSLICAKMLEKDTFKRYHNFMATLKDLDMFQNSGETFSTRQYLPGETIFREGEKGDYAFAVLEGMVEVSRSINGTNVVLDRLGKGEFVGELAIFTNQLRTATITAVGPTEIRIMERASVDHEMQKLSPWVQNMITGLSRRFIKLNTKLTE